MNISIPKIPERTITLPAVKDILKGLILIALSRTEIFGMSPLGLAFAGTFAPKNAYIAFIGLCFGTANFGTGALPYILTFFIYYILSALKKLQTTPKRIFALSFFLLIFSGLPKIFTGINTVGAITLVGEAVLTGGIYFLFTFLDRKGYVANFAQMIIFGGILTGISGAVIPYVNVSLSAFCGVFAALCITYACELPLAALSSGILAFCMTLGTPDAIRYFGAFSICAALGSLLSGFGKVGVATGFLCGLCVSVLYDGTLGAVGIFDLFAPLLAFAILPETVHYRISGIINSRFEAEVEEAPCCEQKIVRQLKTVAGAVCDLAKGVTVGTERDDESCEEIFERVKMRVCKDCSMAETCKRNASYKENMEEIWQTIEEDGYCDLTNMPKGFRQVCLRAERFLNEFGHVYELYKQNMLSLGAAKSSRAIMAMQYSEISNVIELLSEEISDGDIEETEGKRIYSPKITVRREAKEGQIDSGDTVIYFEKGNKFFVILCDGMGSGEDAMHQSRLTARLFEKFLKAGFNKETSLRMINSALALKADQESFSTVDVLEIDTKTGECEFLKIGSAQTFIKKKKEIGVISSKSLPVGILENIETEPFRGRVENGDIILMVTDGISEAGNGVLKTDWIKKLLALEKRSPREIADLIITGAKARTRFRDDMTCCVIKIEKRKEG